MRLVIILILITFFKSSFAATKWDLYSSGGFSEKIIYYTPIIDPKPKVVKKRGSFNSLILQGQQHNIGFQFEYHCKEKRFLSRIIGYATINDKFYTKQYKALKIQNEFGFEGLGLKRYPDGGFTPVKFKSRIDEKMTNLYGYINDRRWWPGMSRELQRQRKERTEKSSVIGFDKKSSKNIFKAKLVTFEVMTQNYGNLLVTFDAQNLPPCKK